MITEGMEFKDCVGLVKPTLYVDAFVSKIGDDDEYTVLSFYVHNDAVAGDLVDWFEKGYDYIIDADRSPGEIEPNRFLVYVEIARRTALVDQIEEILDDLNTLTEHDLADWIITAEGIDMKFDKEILEKTLTLSPHSYREKHETELNEMRTAANLPVKPVHNKKISKDLDIIRQQAGLL